MSDEITQECDPSVSKPAEQYDVHNHIAHFVRSVVAADAAFAVAGDTGLAQVPSPSGDGVLVDLLWSEAQQALKWADVLVMRPELIRLDVATLIETYLPGLAEAGARIGADWSDEPLEPEIAPADLTLQLKRARVEAFAARVAAERQVWLLRDAAGDEVTFPHPASDYRVVPVFCRRDRALAAVDAAWPGAFAIRQASGEFVGKTILKAITQRRCFALDFRPGMRPEILKPQEFKGLFAADPGQWRFA